MATLGGKKTGGMNVYVRELARQLGSFGLKVDVFTRLQERCQPQISTALGDSVRVIHLEAGPLAPAAPDALVDATDDFARRINAFVLSEQQRPYDVIHAHYWLSGLVAERLKEYWGATPVVQMFHTLGKIKRVVDQIYFNSTVTEARIDGELHITSQVADMVIAATDTEADYIAANYPTSRAQIEVIPPGVDLELFTPMDQATARASLDISCGHKLILFAGRIEQLKGIDTLISAFDHVQTDGADVSKEACVIIVGGDPTAEDPEPQMQRLKEHAARLGLTRKVRFLGAKSQDDLPRFFAASDIVVMPSHYESFGMVALEAMAMGRPVIASEVGGLADLICDGVNGLHVRSRDANELAVAIDRVLGDPSLAKRLSDGALNTAQRYSWKAITRRVFDAYERSIILTKSRSTA